MPPRIRRKCFISYHQEDLPEVERFINRFGRRNFIKRGITLPEEVIRSSNTDYVMRKVRELYVRDSTVTIVLIGPCTWSRRFVDWEIQASLRQPAGVLPNGLIGILLDKRIRPPLPPRLALNRESGYAKYHYYPATVGALEDWIEDAYWARTGRSRLIRNPRDRFLRNRACD
jgi:antiphage defense system Thoeris ThsB-like protein